MRPYDWGDSTLLVSVVFRGGNAYCYLLFYVSQEEFFDTMEEQHMAINGREITTLNVTQLTAEAAEQLRPRYEAVGRVLGD